MRDYRKLRAFQAARKLARAVYLLTRTFSEDERYGMTSQMRRAAVSICSNIVEGSSRSSAREYFRFMEIAHGSAAELEFQLSLAKELELVRDVATHEEATRLAVETVNHLGGLVRYLGTDV